MATACSPSLQSEGLIEVGACRSFAGDHIILGLAQTIAILSKIRDPNKVLNMTSSSNTAEKANIATRRDVRNLLRKLYPVEAEFVAFCIDYFGAVAKQFSSGQSRTEKENLLLQSIEPDEIVFTLNNADSQEKSVTIKAGTVLGNRYRLIKQVGQGGFATVWRASDLETGNTDVAVKIFRRLLSLKRFRIGAMEMSKLDHPNIVKVLELPTKSAIKNKKWCYYVMEYMPNGDLHAAIQNKLVSQEEGLRIILQIGKALDYAHGRNLVHRDIKPQNILLDASNRARLSDFDLVRTVDKSFDTRIGIMMGTGVYAAPEQMFTNPDCRADIYSLAVTCLFVLFGHDFPRQDGSWDPISFLGASVSAPLAMKDVLARALSRDPSQRYSTVKQFCDILEHNIEQYCDLGKNQCTDKEPVFAPSSLLSFEKVIEHSTPVTLTTQPQDAVAGRPAKTLPKEPTGEPRGQAPPATTETVAETRRPQRRFPLLRTVLFLGEEQTRINSEETRKSPFSKKRIIILALLIIAIFAFVSFLGRTIYYNSTNTTDKLDVTTTANFPPGIVDNKEQPILQSKKDTPTVTSLQHTLAKDATNSRRFPKKPILKTHIPVGPELPMVDEKKAERESDIFTTDREDPFSLDLTRKFPRSDESNLPLTVPDEELRAVNPILQKRAEACKESAPQKLYTMTIRIYNTGLIDEKIDIYPDEHSRIEECIKDIMRRVKFNPFRDSHYRIYKYAVRF